MPHNPEVIYTYVGEFEFDPNADSLACDRLLSCLEPEQQQILLQTLAASLDLKKIRKLRKQRVRALICKGDGNNGKDSLREQAVFKIGDRVIHTNSIKAAENWCGTVVKLRDDGRFDVEWDERPNNKGKRRVYPHPGCDLRRI